MVIFFFFTAKDAEYHSEHQFEQQKSQAPGGLPRTSSCILPTEQVSTRKDHTGRIELLAAYHALEARSCGCLNEAIQ